MSHDTEIIINGDLQLNKIANEKIRDVARSCYPFLTPSWSQKTAAPAYRYPPPGTPRSYGQCLVTCGVLLNVLKLEFPDATDNLHIALGDVYDTQSHEKIIPNHAWLSWISMSNTDRTICGIMDPTANQATGDKLIIPFEIATHDQLIERGIGYIASRTFPDIQSIIEAFPKDAEDVKERIAIIEAYARMY